MTSPVPEERLVATMRRMELFVIESGPARAPGTLEVLPEHLEHQIRLEREGILFGAGPVWEEGSDIPVAGMIIIRAPGFEEARRIADSDPFHIRGLRSYRLRRWNLNEGAMTVTVRLSDQSAEFR